MREGASVFSYKMWLERWSGEVLQGTKCSSHQSKKLLPCPETPFKKKQKRFFRIAVCTDTLKYPSLCRKCLPPD